MRYLHLVYLTTQGLILNCNYLLEVRSESIHHFGNFMAQLVRVHVYLEEVAGLATLSQPVVLIDSLLVLPEDLVVELLLCWR